MEFMELCADESEACVAEMNVRKDVETTKYAAPIQQEAAEEENRTQHCSFKAKSILCRRFANSSRVCEDFKD